MSNDLEEPHHLPRLHRLKELLKDEAELESEGKDMTNLELDGLSNENKNVKIEEDKDDYDTNSIGICIECEDHPSQVFCEQCHDYFCILCYEGQHRKGNRKTHTYQPITDSLKLESEGEIKNKDINEDKDESSDEDNRSRSRSNICSVMGNLILSSLTTNDKDLTSSTKESSILSSNNSSENISYRERAKYIPLRLTYEERKLLRTLEAALSVSNYTGKLDTEKFMHKGKRLRMQLQEICGFLTGVVVATNYQVGQIVLDEHNFSESMDFFQELFELGRRYKIMNPEKMRGEYGKLMYMLQDACTKEIEELLGFSIHMPIRTVYELLNEQDALKLLDDPRLSIATKVVSPENKTRSQIQKEIRKKETTIKALIHDYSHEFDLNEEDIATCLYSIGDNQYHLYYERDPIDRMISLLQTYFNPDDSNDSNTFSLAIVSGNDGARLSHSHQRQYHYVLQSLSLWREIAHDMFRLWYLTDEDLLSSSENPYKLTDTGQGLHRIQASSKVSRAMHVILHTAQRKLGHWVGSSVIHLGDSNVPNALMFIDKYAQVGHILRPIVKTIEEIDRLHQSSNDIRTYIDEEFEGCLNLKQSLLCDFFREAFDGSGADNFFEAGSCIDGRLTSAWNWCSNLHTKKFYPFFKLAGFVGFDGKFG